MHISEGVLPGWLLITGWGLTIGATYFGLKNLKDKKVPLAALLAAAFFIASLIHVPLGPSSVHLVMNGLAGLLLGITAFPVILVGLFLQAVLFQFGGITVLGINTFNMAFPAFLSYLLLRRFIKKQTTLSLVVVGVLTAFISIMGSGILVALELLTVGEVFKKTAELVILAHLPVAVVEGIINAFVLLFLRKTAPEILGGLK
ncbi:MAG: cobalt transporter CbiM [Desulfurobacteriaceae bacterium]